MKSYLLVLFLVGLTFAANPDLDEEWADFVQRYDKNYELEGEEEVIEVNLD